MPGKPGARIVNMLASIAVCTTNYLFSYTSAGKQRPQVRAFIILNYDKSINLRPASLSSPFLEFYRVPIAIQEMTLTMATVMTIATTTRILIMHVYKNPSLVSKRSAEDKQCNGVWGKGGVGDRAGPRRGG